MPSVPPRSKKLADKVALVTGAGQGIGLAIAREFKEHGATIVAAEINPDTASQTASELSGECMALEMDISSKTSVVLGNAKILDRYGRLDILVNNAGVLTYTTWEDCSEEDWDQVVNTNLKGTFLCSQAVLPAMTESRSGVIINLSSIAAKTGGTTVGPHYASSKAGIVALTLGLAKVAAPRGIRVNGIAPGVVATPMTDNPRLVAYGAQVPLGEMGRPEDIAHCALFLASDDARHITGEIIDVNGGLFMD